MNAPCQKSEISTTLSFDGCVVTATSLQLPKDCPFARAEKILNGLVGYHEALPWLIGDLLAQAEIIYGESYAQLIEPTGKAVNTLMQYHRVSKAVKSCSRLQNLSWSHHQEVAGMERKDQERWLQRAADKGWTRTELRAAIHAPRTVAVKAEVSNLGNPQFKKPTLAPRETTESKCTQPDRLEAVKDATKSLTNAQWRKFLAWVKTETETDPSEPDSTYLSDLNTLVKIWRRLGNKDRDHFLRGIWTYVEEFRVRDEKGGES